MNNSINPLSTARPKWWSGGILIAGVLLICGGHYFLTQMASRHLLDRSTVSLYLVVAGVALVIGFMLTDLYTRIRVIEDALVERSKKLRD
jgi:hypothetical protein